MSTSGGLVDRATLEDLAAASRILADQGVFDAAGHVSMRHPGHPERFLMSRSLAPQMITADDIMEFDLDCNAIDARGRNGFIERYLHGEILRARPDVVAVAHSHSPSVIAFGLSNTPMLAMYHNAAFLAAGVPVFDIREKFGTTDIVISTAAKGAALAQVLADKSVALLRAHGMVAVGSSLPVAVFRAIFTVTSANIQHQALALGGPLAALDAEEGRIADVVNVQIVGRTWDLWKSRVMKKISNLARRDVMAQPSQQEIKQELVDAIRMLEHAEYIDHNGHCSVRRDANSFYINSGASMRASLTVEDIVAVDLDGKPVDGGNVKPPLEFPIHAEVYRARPKVNAVFHTHPQWSTYLTMTGHPQKVVYAQASLLGDMPVMNSPMSVNTREMGEKMVGVMGENPVVMLKAHGVVAAGETVLECFAYAAYVEENARRQYMAMQIGDPYVFSDEEQAACRQKLRRGAPM